VLFPHHLQKPIGVDASYLSHPLARNQCLIYRTKDKFDKDSQDPLDHHEARPVVWMDAEIRAFPNVILQAFLFSLAF
jgi:hypothetical protein